MKKLVDFLNSGVELIFEDVVDLDFMRSILRDSKNVSVCRMNNDFVLSKTNHTISSIVATRRIKNMTMDIYIIPERAPEQINVVCDTTKKREDYS